MSGEYGQGNGSGAPAGVPAAWYADPETSGQMRYWDGSGWTENQIPTPPTAPPTAPPANVVAPSAAASGPTSAPSGHRRAAPKKSRRTALIAAAVAAVLIAAIAGFALRPSNDGSAIGATSPTPTPSDSPSLSPSPSISPTPTPSPSTTPTTTTTPTPRVTPSPPPTSPAAIPQPYEKQSFSGTGRKVVRLTRVVGPVLVTMKHTGLSNFTVWAVDSGGKKNDLLANTIGNYSGTRIGGAGDNDVAAFTVDADGPWSIAITPISTAPVWKGRSTIGRGDVVLRTGLIAGLVTIKANYTGTGNFAVWAYDDSRRSLIFNEIDKFSGESLLPEGTIVVAVESDGPWTLTRA